MRLSALLRLVAFLSLVVSPSLRAQNLVENGGFATDTSGWTPFPGITLTWDSQDAYGSALSGSMIVSVEGTEGLNSVAGQCVNSIVPGQSYDFGAIARIPPGGATGQAFVRLSWFSEASCFGSILGLRSLDVGTSAVPHELFAGDVAAPAGAVSVRFEIQLVKNFSNPLPYRAQVDDLFLGRTGTCIPRPTTLCIDDEPGDFRFEVEVEFATAQAGGLSGFARAIPLASVGVLRGGAFWFFGEENPELLLKILNACTFNGRYWMFFSAGTNVGFTVRVTDTPSQRLKTYTNPDLKAAEPVQDTQAFPCD